MFHVKHLINFWPTWPCSSNGSHGSISSPGLPCPMSGTATSPIVRSFWPSPPSQASGSTSVAAPAFPVLVIAIMAHGSAGPRVTLIESDRRKCAFLAEVARHTGISVEIRTARIEQIATQRMLGAVDVVSARALAPLVRLIPLSLPFFGDATLGLLSQRAGRGIGSDASARSLGFRRRNDAELHRCGGPHRRHPATASENGGLGP